MTLGIWDLYLPKIVLVQTACSVFGFSRYHTLMLHMFSAFSPVCLALGTSITPDMLDVAFLIAVNTTIWWTNIFNRVVDQAVSKSDNYVNLVLWGIQFAFIMLFAAIAGYILAFIISSTLCVPVTIYVVLFSGHVLASRIVWMIVVWNGIRRIFKPFNKPSSSFRLDIFRLGLAVGASVFFMRENGLFSSDVYYLWDRISTIWMGEVVRTPFDDRYFVRKSWRVLLE